MRLTVAVACGLVALSVACADKAKVQIAQAPPPETVFVRQPEPAPPPPEPLAVTPHLVGFNAIGDTERLSLPEGATCVAASENIAVVDSTGLVRATGNGATHLRCWQGEHNAQVKINVAQEVARVQVVADEGLAMRKSGDSLHLNLARVDRLGTPVAGSKTMWSSLAPDVVRVDSTSGVVFGVADSGTARIVGTAAQVADTVIVEVGVKQAATQLLSSTSRTASSRLRTLARANSTQRFGLRAPGATSPTGIVNQSLTSPAQVVGGNGVGARNPQPGDSLFKDPAFGLAAHRVVVPSLLAGFAEHRIITTLGGLEKTSGAIYGGGLSLTSRGVLGLRFQFMSGTLSKDTSTAADLKLTDGSVDATVAIAPWLNIIGGVEARRYESTAIQRWVMVGAGAETNFSLGGGSLRGIARLKLLPLISIASDVGTVTSPSFGLSGGFGIGFENRRISSSLLYDIERYSFPNGSGRKEQFGALLFQLGYRLGW
ncbi:MAG TPA: hypothetical protein VGI92_04285 [Gemmatimonadales bacterium]|jgi:hypothetical protein